MATSTIPQVTARQAQALANLFLSEHLPDRFTADQASFDLADNLWRVPVILAYPVIGSIGQIGEILINAETEEVIFHTPFEEMKQTALKLYQTRRGDIEAAFS